MKTQMSWVLALALAAASACNPDDQQTGAIDASHVVQDRESLPREVMAQIDSGNQAYRVGDLDAALRHFSQATRLQPDLAAGWFGVYMVEHALGHDASANEALERARKAVPGATLIAPVHPDSTL